VWQQVILYFLMAIVNSPSFILYMFLTASQGDFTVVSWIVVLVRK
jgi:hypothetical protein